MNKLLAVSLSTLFLAGSLSGCSDNNNGNSSNGASSSSSSSSSSGGSSSSSSSSSGSGSSSGSSSSSGGAQALTTTLDPGVAPNRSTINVGVGIGKNSGNTPFTLDKLKAYTFNSTPYTDTNNTDTTTTATFTTPYSYTTYVSKGTVPDHSFGLCDYHGTSPVRVTSLVGGSNANTVPAGQTGGDPSVAMAPFYFPLVFSSPITTTAHAPAAPAGAKPIVGLFDWRPKDNDEALVAAESDDGGQTWYYMQTVLELYPDETNPTYSAGVSTTATGTTTTPPSPAYTGCPATVSGDNGGARSASAPPVYPASVGYQNTGADGADDGWGHATVIQLPGALPAQGTATGSTGFGGQYLYLLDRNTSSETFAVNGAATPTTQPVNDNAQLWVVDMTWASQKFPIGNYGDEASTDLKSIYTALNSAASGTKSPVRVQQTKGLLNPDGIMAVFPTPAATAGTAGTPVTVMYVQKILGGDNTGSTALPAAEQCAGAPAGASVPGTTNHDISNVRLATTTDGITFTDLGIVQGLNDPTTVDYTKTRWISPRGSLIDINGDQSRWGLYFSGGNCLDGDSDAFHYIGYAESTDKLHWTVYNGINNPIISINTETVYNDNNAATHTGSQITVPATAPLAPTQAWFAQRLYAPTAVQIDSTHLNMTFAGYGSQKPAGDLLNYRAIGNLKLTVSKALPAGTPNNSNMH